MATGAAPALDPKAETKTETVETGDPKPLTLKQRITRLLHEIFEGREEYAGWHQ
jgi:hypothetical protein